MITKRQVICKVINDAIENEAFKIALEEIKQDYSVMILNANTSDIAIDVYKDYKAYERFVGKLTAMANEYRETKNGA
jgi:hypothetical protein